MTARRSQSDDQDQRIGVGIVSKQDAVTFSLAGLVAWAAATAYYVAFGPQLFEQAFWFYVLNAFLAAGATTLMFQAAVRLRRVSQRKRPMAAALFSAPGIVCGALLLIKLTDFFPQLDPVTVGRYGAFLLVGYATVVTMAFDRKLKPASSPAR